MQFTPQTAEQANRLFEKGRYKFKVLKSEEKTSKSGQPMIALSLQIQHDKIVGKTNVVNCFLMPFDPNFAFLVRHFCYSVGMGAQYESKKLIADSFVGKIGAALVGISIDKSGTYPDQNKILDFIEGAQSTTQPIPFNDSPYTTINNVNAVHTVTAPLNDDIPW